MVGIKDIVTDYFGYNRHEKAATEFAKSRGYGPGKSNAFAHAYVSAMITKEHGALVAYILRKFKRVPDDDPIPGKLTKGKSRPRTSLDIYMHKARC
jgi:hypothetical protein